MSRVLVLFSRDLRVRDQPALAGARYLEELLIDADVANNSGNWQWVAGTGNDTRPNRVLNPERQARRFDPDGAYLRRYLALEPFGDA